MVNQRIVWTVSAVSGGRVQYGKQLAKAFREIGCQAGEVFRSRFLELKQNYPDHEGKELLQHCLDEMVAELEENPPDIIVDFSPLPPEFYELAHDCGVKTVFWFLENGTDVGFDYWKKYDSLCDLFLFYQGDPFNPEEGSYLPWGSPYLRKKPQELRKEIVFHGSAMGARKQFIEDFVRQFDFEVKVRVVGPDWDNWNFPASYDGPVKLTVDDKWTEPRETMELLANRYVVIPYWKELNAIVPRCWLTLGAGSCVFMEDLDVLDKHLRPGEDLLTFDGPLQAQQKVEELLENHGRAKKIMESGWTETKSNHLLKHRAKSIIKILK